MNIPTVIKDYLAAHESRDVSRAMAFYSASAEVVDDGAVYRGVSSIGAWLAGAAREYSYTVVPTAITSPSAGRYDLLQHLEGDFPGGVVDLYYRFTLVDGMITRLVIEP
ncbi:nuclear transport factor 2 family protein [Asanoa siamensis]|uniref:SnoaL-like domain-containing protein n=1 Tax=Asanoa siamensis TaxID=926357 RepID=A0ABQ4CIS6_9ACTN|nr:nuclear transport factor 2 family protein [Asanoa siamensis]GIF71196.1 hypothetical protein Asi02nite_07140 [Asanoa siamensis]